ncbi:uncharacterized protein GGS22DRAFT_153013 [Annulohypoxylon maeteangense]|uniref:uncharacterized protein n=1 Tax=Annulohypoxylon maeteangense TaxID=1927788 RepID=UPI00200869D3|nr:uncharacterized protein GGS22DRAFT_153013 [Annulohypoxylon maeteangense]KAI0889053.1 hypothetical protein GGS22DRAFT_153013 [Annulohypoxylon maeteangense]
MAGFTSWFSRSAPNSSPITPAGANNGFLRNRIFGGRVTKHSWTPKKKTHEELADKVEGRGWKGLPGTGEDATQSTDDEEASHVIKKEEDSDHFEEDEIHVHNHNYGDDKKVDDRPETPDRVADSYNNVLAIASIEDELLQEPLEHPAHHHNGAASDVEEEEERIALSDDGTASESEASSTTQETNQDYDPEDGWRYEQVFLNQILRGRDEYSLMPSTWKMHFRGIPLPEGLFYIKTHAVSTRPRIYARTERLEYRGAIALRRLMDIHGRIRDIRKARTDATRDEDERRIVKHIRGRVQDVLRWAELDGDIAKYSNSLPPNVRLIEMYDADKDNMHVPIQDSMAEVAASWREVLNRIPKDQRPTPPVIFGLVIFKHILFIVTLDSQDPLSCCHIPIQVNLSEMNQNQWNALAIMVTVCWARDLFADVASKIPDLLLEDPNVDSDPDA